MVYDMEYDAKYKLAPDAKAVVVVASGVPDANPALPRSCFAAADWAAQQVHLWPNTWHFFNFVFWCDVGGVHEAVPVEDEVARASCRNRRRDVAASAAAPMWSNRSRVADYAAVEARGIPLD